MPLFAVPIVILTRLATFAAATNAIIRASHAEEQSSHIERTQGRGDRRRTHAPRGRVEIVHTWIAMPMRFDCGTTRLHHSAGRVNKNRDHREIHHPLPVCLPFDQMNNPETSYTCIRCQTLLCRCGGTTDQGIQRAMCDTGQAGAGAASDGRNALTSETLSKTNTHMQCADGDAGADDDHAEHRATDHH